MSKQDNERKNTPEEPEILLDEVNQGKQEPEAEEENAAQAKAVEEAVQAATREQEDKYLRLLAEYDNYRKRSQKEKEHAWTSAKADTIKELLPVYDNLERAMKQETSDEAYAKGVQMTMQQLKTVLEKLGVEEIPAQDQPFDPNVHNAVMHVDDEALGENTIVEVFQAGFRMGDTIIRHAMVKVAN